MRDPKEILHRALLMAALSVRFSIEYSMKHTSLLYNKDIETIAQMSNVISRTKHFRDLLTRNEKVLTEVNVGEWASEIITQISWYSESAGMLLWGVQQITKLPPFDEPFSFEVLNNYFKDISTLSWMIPFSEKNVSLRNVEEIMEIETQYEALFQRCIYSHAIRHKNKKIPTNPYEEIFHFSKMGLPVGDSGDIIVFKHEFCDLTEQEEKVFLPIITSRLQAIEWMMKPSYAWDDVSIDYLYKLP